MYHFIIRNINIINIPIILLFYIIYYIDHKNEGYEKRAYERWLSIVIHKTE